MAIRTKLGSVETGKVQSHFYMQFLVSGFIICCMYFMALWICPSFCGRDVLFQPAQAFSKYLGLELGFTRLFAPDPEIYNRFVKIVVTFDNKNRIYWQYEPQPLLLNGLMQWRFSYYKWRYILLADKEIDKKLWKYVARFVARNADTSTSHPICIQFVEYLGQICVSENPSSHAISSGRVSRTVLFIYLVLPGDLR